MIKTLIEIILILICIELVARICVKVYNAVCEFNYRKKTVRGTKVKLPKFKLREFITKSDAYQYLDLLFYDGCIDRRSYDKYYEKVHKTNKVVRIVDFR